jgi:hypothetical protein
MPAIAFNPIEKRCERPNYDLGRMGLPPPGNFSRREKLER